MDTYELLKLLVCPACRTSLTLVETGKARGFACSHCNTVYPVRNDIPILLIEEAIPAPKWYEVNK